MTLRTVAAGFLVALAVDVALVGMVWFLTS
jgi:hypothetical protein